MGRCVCVIFARGGSKGVPRKNLRPLGGVPLIGHSIRVGQRVPGIDGIFVSTDDEEIARIARAEGAEVPFMRPPELATDTAPEWLAWRHAIATLGSLGVTFDRFVTLPATSPMRGVEDVTATIECLDQADTDVVITVQAASRNPYYNMVELDPGGYARVVIGAERELNRRQDAPKVYDITTVAYATRPEFVMTAPGLFAGRTRAVVVPRERAVDIDDELDFQFAEFLLSRRARA